MPEQGQEQDPIQLVDASPDAGGSDSDEDPPDRTDTGTLSDTGTVPPDTHEDPGTDSGFDAMGMDTTGCPAGERECGGQCVDIATSNQHCGGCGNACPGTSTCQSMACTCSGSQKLCGGQCVDVTSDANHCGSCNNQCASAQSCTNSSCSCPGGEKLCNGSCVDTSSSSEHCGTCGNQCGGGKICKNSQCESTTKVKAVVRETNNVRSTQTDCGQYGVKSSAPPLTENAELNKAAQVHAEDMAMQGDIFHTGTDGSDFATRIRRTNFQGRPVAENVAAGNSTAAATVGQWERSDGHCKNMMLQRATHIGVGVANNPMSTYRWYWVQVFGKK